ncbi:MAG: hypothetical protein ACK456_08220 [Pseudanabaenaceae cyanobacterium]|jgi:hypothetical protein
MSKISFFSPLPRYQGEFTPVNLLFDANLQEFAHRVSIISALESGGKISPLEAYEHIQHLWQGLSLSKEQLGIGD